jgi:type IV secretory pathway TraG/TraD family ATPase VirD4
MGPTRSGKSQLLLSLCAQDMAARRSLFFMEAKGDVSDFHQFARLAQLTGRLADLRYFNPADPASMTFNPIRPVPGQDATEVANQISRAIGREPGGGGESEFFRNVDYARIQTMTEIFMASGLEFTLKDAFYYFQFEQCRNRAYSFCSDKSLIALTKRQFEGPAGDTTALTANLRPWISGRLGALLNSYEPQIRLEDVFSHDRLAYFAIPIGRLQVLANPLGRMVIAGLMGVAAMRQSMAVKPEPAAVILDEFPEFATPVFASLIATVGSAKLWTIFSHQDLGQLMKVVGTPPEAFFSALFSNSSGCKVFFHLPHPDDAELIAKAAGTFTTTKATEAVETGLLGAMKTGGKSMREVEEFLAHPNLLRSLKPGLAVAWAHGGRPAVVSTAVAHEMVRDQTPVLLPEVRGTPARGLDLASALPKDKPAAGDKDFMGRTPEAPTA